MDENMAEIVADEEILDPEQRPEDDVDLRSILARDPLLLLIVPTPENAAEKDRWNTERKKVQAYLDRQTDRDRTVILARYGVDGTVKTLEEVAEMLGVSRERARTIEKGAVIRFRRMWGRKYGCVYGAARRRFERETSEMAKGEIRKRDPQDE